MRGDSDANLTASSEILLRPDSVVADGQTRMQVTVKLSNALLVSSANLQVTLVSDFEPAQIIQPTPANSQGEAVGYIYSAQMGQATLRAYVQLHGQQVLLDAHAIATFTDPLLPLQIQLSLHASNSPTTVGKDNLIELTAVAVDVDGAAVRNQVVEFTSSDPNDLFTATSVVTDSMGMAKTQVSSEMAGSRNITARMDYAQASTSVQFTADVANNQTSYIALTLPQIYADGVHATTAKVTATDQYDNPIVGVLVYLVSDASGDTITPSSAYTDAQGCAYFQLTSVSSGTHTLTASMQSISVSTNVEILVPEPSAAQSFITSNPSSQTADGGSEMTIITQVRDPIGVNLPGIAVTLTASGTGNSFGNATGVTDANGIFTTTLVSTKAETKLITALLPNTSLNASVTFVPGMPSTATSTLTLSPAVLLANGTVPTGVTLVAMDSSGNVIPNCTVTLSASGSDNVFSQVTGSTNAYGVFSSLWRSTKAELKTLTASLGTITLQQNANFTADPNHVSATITATAQDTVADGSSTNPLSITLVDAYNNPVAGASVSFVVTGDNTFSPQSGVTDVNGHFISSVASTTAGEHTITVNAGNTSASTQVNFVAGAPSSGQSTVQASPTGNVTANGTSTSTITVTVVDAYDNPIAGQAVSLNSTGTNNTFGATSGTSNSSGMFTTTLRSTTAETKTITANFGSASAQTQVTFVAGHADQTQSALVASPSSTTADGSSQIAFVLTVLDAQGNAVPNVSVSLSTNGQNDNFAPSNTGTTDTDGTLNFTLSSTHAESKTVTASVDGIALNRNVTFTAGAPNQSHSTLTVSPSSVVANNSAVSNIVLTVRDAYDNPVSNVAVALTSSGASSDTLTQISTQTNASGVVTATIASQLAQTDTITASFAALTLSGTVQFIASSPDASQSTLTASPTSLTADGTSNSVLTFTVKDTYGNPTPSVTVNFSITNGSGATLATSSGTTNSAGIFTTSVTATVANDVTVQAQTNGGTVTENVVLHFVAGTPDTSQSSFSASPSEVVADDQALISLSMVWRDAHGNVIPSQS